MNTGAEGVETAIKITRKWGHTVKGIPEGRDVDQALFWVWWDVFKQALTWLPDTLKWLWDILF